MISFMPKSNLQAEDNCESLTKELLQTKTSLVEIEEEKKRLESEAAQLKEMLRREHETAEGENSRNQAIIGDYKQVNNAWNTAKKIVACTLHRQYMTQII